MKKLLFVIILISSMSSFLKGQVTPPTFLCVKGDTLFWELPTNSCGPFISYDVYTSDDLNGLYNLLTSIPVASQDFFYHPNPAGLLLYYYLVSNFDCPGQAQSPSDTLDSRPPEIAPLLSVTVQGGDILLSWLASPSPEVYAYIVYRRDPIGVVPIDTVFGGTVNYLDVNAEPDMEAEGYFVNALDQCGNTSIFDAEHKTIFLEGEATNCSIDLNWNLYQNWNGGIGAQGVWVSENGGIPILHESIDGNSPFYSFRDVNDGSAYCFFLQANESGTGELSRSNEICLTASFSQPINELYIANVSVGADNSVSLDWGINANADLEILEFLRSGTTAVFENINTETPLAPFPIFNQYLDGNANAVNGPLIYQLYAVDSCGNELSSATATTIFLSGNQLDVNTSQLNWTPLVIENAVVNEYKIIRIASGNEMEVGTVGSNGFSFEDVFDLSAIGSGTVCYYIEAESVVTSPGGMDRSITSRSNILCLDQEIRVFVPNALAPEGLNREFKAVILSGNIARYEMQIFDRYGSIVFSADNPDEAWKGKRGGKKLPQGVYVYRIHLVLENGKEVEKKGNVLLLR